MPDLRKCATCGADLPSDSPAGQCVRCLLEFGFESAEEPTVATQVVASTTERPGDRIGRYKLREKLGEGGCGVVYVADQEEPVRRRVALKVIKLGMDTNAVVARFEAERQALAMMDHPNIAKVLDGGTTDQGRPYFVMELVRGVRITDYCDQNNLSTKDRLDLFIKVCQAIQHAHQKGIIHRDIKPSNILVTLHDGVPVPKVIDFGIAKATEGRLTNATVYTQLHQFMGTLAYMSPEQAEMSGLDIDTRSDIYSLGVLLYELLAGATPFDAEELMASGIDAMRKTIREKEPVRPSTRLATLQGEELTATAKRRSAETSKLMHQLQGDLDWIVMKCLEKDRTRRYETANGLATDLKRHLTNEPVVARPPSTTYRLQKAWRRNKIAFSAASAVAVALLAGLGFSTWSLLRERKAHAGEITARQTADQQRQLAEANSLTAKRREAEALHLLYVANMNLAQAAWEQNNVGRVRRLLDETESYPRRGFEWYYWQRQTHLEIKTLRGHSGGINSVAYSSDGQRIVTGSFDGTAKLWEADSGGELLTLKGYNSVIWSVAISPDGQRIVTGSDGRTATIWGTASGKVLQVLKGHTSAILSAAFSPDGLRIVTGSGNPEDYTPSVDHTAKVWEAATGKELLTLKGHSNGINSVVFSPDGQRIITGSRDQTAKVWDATSGKELLTLKGHTSGINSVAFSSDGQRIATGSGDWSVTTDNTAKVWDATSGRELLTLKGHRHNISCVAFSPDGQRIVTGSYDHTAEVWEANSGKQLFIIRGHGSAINSVAFSPDGQRIVTCSGDWRSTGDNTARVWAASGAKDPLTLMGHSHNVNSVAFSPDGRRIITGSYDHTAKVWEANSGKQLLTLIGHSNAVTSVAFSPDGQRIVTGSKDQTAKIWDAADGKYLLTLSRHSAGIMSVAFSPDSQLIATASSDHTAEVWEAASGKALVTLTGHNDRIVSVAFSPDGQRIVTGSWDATAKVWETATGRELLTLRGHKSNICSVAFSPDGGRIATGSCDATAKVWETAHGKELLTLTGHSDQVWAVGFSPDGQRIVTGCVDGTAKIWDAATGEELLTLARHSGPIATVVFSPEGERIATGSYDNTAKVWEAATAKQVTAWREEERVAEQHVASMQRERTAEDERRKVVRARESIKQWLILAPISLATGQTGMEGLDIQQIEGEGQLRPRAGEPKSIVGGESKWRMVSLTNEVIDFNAILGRLTEHSVAYAVCYLQSEAEQRGLQMLVGSDDAAKVYLNGKQIYRSLSPRPFSPEQERVPDVVLKAGLNVLVFKVVNEIFDWVGAMRFTDSQGNPVKGIKVTLDPNAKD
jgi:WD40 repeat protein/serine/threonine protein kinase